MNNLYDVWFSTIELSNNVKKNILEKYSSEQLFNFSRENFSKFGFDEKIISKIISSKKLNINKYFCFLEKYNIKVITINSKEYPVRLKLINNPPTCLYVRGNLENLYANNIAIVGSRNASQYGKYISRKIGKEIADKNINVVSGLAIGIDKYAHLGALDSNIGKTIAVIATGVSDEEVYPLQNKKIFERILESGGTIISEYKIGTKPEKYNFPLRNRIISGISNKVIVVEAEEKSGSLITVDHALEQGKDVFAVPGNITSPKSVGTNKLIDEGAYVFKSVEDVL